VRTAAAARVTMSGGERSATGVRAASTSSPIHRLRDTRAKTAYSKMARPARLLGDVELHQDARFLELDHEPTGIQLSLFGDEAGITVTYWYAGSDAAAIVGLLCRSREMTVVRSRGLHDIDIRTCVTTPPGTA
jgi:hypothetical protein